MTQPPFDFDREQLIVPRDSRVTAPTEVRRLGGQNGRLLSELMRHTLTRAQIAEFAPNVTARISDVRAYVKRFGFTVDLIEENQVTGFTRYGIRHLSEVA